MSDSEPSNNEAPPPTANTVPTPNVGTDDVLSNVFSHNKPENLVAGLAGGVLEVAKGLGLGVACLGASSYAGVTQGVASGNVKTAAIGVGAGIAGFAALSVYGAYRGVRKAIDGAVNTYDAVIAARDGDMMFSDERGAFVRVNLEEEFARLPPTDDDIFDEAQLALLKDKKTSPTSPSEASSAPSHSHADDKALYRALGVDVKASRDEIRKAYTKKALALHPDKNPSPEAAKEFQLVAEAYRVLSNEVERARYDAGATTSGGSSADPTKRPATSEPQGNPFEVLAGTSFHPWVGRLRYLLYLHPHMKFSTSLMTKYEQRKQLRAAQFLVRILSSHDTPEATVEAVRPLIEDIMASPIGPEIALSIAEQYASTVRQFHEAGGVRELDKMFTDTMTMLANGFTLAKTAVTAIGKYKSNALNGDEAMVHEVILGGCNSDVQHTAATTARCILIDNSVTLEVRERRAELLLEIARAMTSLATTKLAERRSTQPRITDAEGGSTSS